jgi:Cu/Ag efflux pump CusA
MNVRGRDVGGFVDEAQRAVAREVKMPPGYGERIAIPSH